MPGGFIPYGCQAITANDIKAVTEVLSGEYLTQGPAVPKFEQEVADKVNANHAVAVNSATSALHLAYLALGLGPDDWLWTSATMFVATANCGRYCGAKVDFIDIDIKTGLIDIKALEAKLRKAEATQRLLKIKVPVHLCGSSCDMKQVSRLAKQYKIGVIEDASLAICARYESARVGSCQYSDITVFSFRPVKIITTGEGGMATTNHPELASRMKALRTHGITKDPSEFVEQDPATWIYEQQTLGFNYRMNDIQAALGSSQLTRLDKIIEERTRLYEQYKTLLDDEIDFLEIPRTNISSLHLCVIRFKEEDSNLHRLRSNQMRSAGIGVQIHYSPVHLQPYYRDVGFAKGDHPNAERYANSAMTIPLFPGLSRANQNKVVEELRNVGKLAVK